MTAIQKISARAKAIRKKSPGKAWKACIKQASREYNAGSLGAAKKKPAAKKKAAKKKKVYQTGKSTKFNDQVRTAKKPGVRKTRWGTKYTERRKNRSDMPGKLTGTAYNEMILRNLKNENTNLEEGERRLILLQAEYKRLPKGTAKKLIAKEVKRQKNYIREVKRNIRMLRTMVG